jgi:hypothetical protein
MSGELTFRVALTIERLSNAPFNHSRLFVKWKTPSQESQGSTRIAEVRDHNCIWADEVSFDVKLKVDKSNTLNPHVLRFSVREASPTRGMDDFKRLGIAEFDLAAVARIRESFHRVLLQKTKATETLHFSIEMQQLSGAPTFRCPPLPPGIQDVGAQAAAGGSAVAGGTPLKQQPSSADPMADLLRHASGGGGGGGGGGDRESLGGIAREPSLTMSAGADRTPLSAAASAPSHRRGPSSEAVVDSVFAAVFRDAASKSERTSAPEPQQAAEDDRQSAPF